MKRIGIIALSIVMILSLSACGNKTEEKNSAGTENTAKTENTAQNAEETEELVVFAAASMTETLNKIKENFEAENPGVKLTYTFDSSGTLKTQIEEGAVCDVFISAAMKQMNALSDGGFIKDDTRFDLLENAVTLAVPNGNSKGVSSFSDMNSDKVETIAIGNADVPVGQYSEELLSNLGIWDEIQQKITFGSNVKEVTAWISEGAADCGIVYKTDAYSAGLEVVDEAEEGMIKTPVVYPAAVLEKSEHKEAAEAFLEYLKNDESKKIFEEVGFKTLN